MTRPDNLSRLAVARRSGATGVAVTLLLATISLTGCHAGAAGSAGPATTPADAESPTQPSQTRLETAAGNCEATPSLADEGASISFDTEGEEDTSGDDIAVVACVLNELDVPTYVVEHMDSTRALDGTQEDNWDGLKARWTYHPDAGMQLTVIDTKLTQ